MIWSNAATFKCKSVSVDHITVKSETILDLLLVALVCFGEHNLLKQGGLSFLPAFKANNSISFWRLIWVIIGLNYF